MLFRGQYKISRQFQLFSGEVDLQVQRLAGHLSVKLDQQFDLLANEMQKTLAEFVQGMQSSGTHLSSASRARTTVTVSEPWVLEDTQRGDPIGSRVDDSVFQCIDAKLLDISQQAGNLTRLLGALDAQQAVARLEEIQDLLQA